jgi:O-acetyl-ADP-ribose deacetylase (regulator of RNase III)
MPAISSGIFGFPKDRCAKILVNEAKRFLQEHKDTSLEIAKFCIFDDISLGYFEQEFDKLK